MYVVVIRSCALENSSTRMQTLPPRSAMRYNPENLSEQIALPAGKLSQLLSSTVKRDIIVAHPRDAWDSCPLGLHYQLALCRYANRSSIHTLFCRLTCSASENIRL